MAEPHMIGEWSCGEGKHGRFALAGTRSAQVSNDGYVRTHGLVPLPVLAWLLVPHTERLAGELRALGALPND